MVAYIARRFGTLLLTLLIVTVGIFVLMHSVPGGPFEVVNSKQPLPPFAYENIQRKYGLDRPIWEQYVRWLWAALHGDFGIPFESPTETVTGLIARAWRVTLRVGGLTLILAYSLGLFLGIIAAVKQNTWIDSVATVLATMDRPPELRFWFLAHRSVRGDVALVSDWRLLPTKPADPPGDRLRADSHGEYRPLHSGEHAGGNATKYVTMARARGLPEWRVLRRYVLRTALIPLITILGPSISGHPDRLVPDRSAVRAPGPGQLLHNSKPGA